MKTTFSSEQSGLSKQELEQLLTGQLVIHCPSMQLVPGSRGAGESLLAGPGTIRFSVQEGIIFTLHPTKTPRPQALIDGLAMEAGKMIELDQMHTLKAVDLHKREWTAERVMPDFESGPGGTVVSGQLIELELRTNDKAARRDTLEVLVPGRLAFAPNTSRKETLEIASEQRGCRMSFDVARTTTCEIELELANKEGFAKLSGRAAHGRIRPEMVEAILESLSIVTASPVKWCLLDHVSCGLRRIRIRMPQTPVGASRVGPPVCLRVPSVASWRLFDLCVAYYDRLGSSDAPTLGQIFSMIVDAGRSSIEVESIVLSAAVEVLLRHHVALKAPNGSAPDFTSDTNRLRVLVQDERELGDRFRDRLLGFLGSLGNPRAKDQLEWLRARGLINKKQIAAFGKLRNASAHGAMTSADCLQEQVDLCAEVLVLAYHVLFALVGYEGEYIDYSKRDFPTVHYAGQVAWTSNHED